jgi:hypothetical protein
MSRARSTSAGRSYGRARVLTAWGLPRSTFYERRRRPLFLRPPARRGPKTRYSDEDLLAEIRRTIQESPFHVSTPVEISPFGRSKIPHP